MNYRAARARGRSQHGFTLLEVMLALTICTIALASLFSVIVGSKQLIFRAQGALEESVELRSLVSLSLLVDPEGELLAPSEDSEYRIALIADELEPPERKTDTTTEALYQYEIEDEEGEVVLRGTYWVTLEEAE
jgi:prepilin-type N-terminal cleavage/methylation domain-containing protein